jgi:hypothetical protein
MQGETPLVGYTGENAVTDIYIDKYVVFLDLLGFKNRVEEADRDPPVRHELLQVLALVRNTLCENPSLGMSLTHFSDCIIFSANRSREGLWEILQSVNQLTLNLLQYDFLVRGGLAVGGTHHDSSFVYGLAINRAYCMERCAKNPMTIVSEQVVADAKGYGPDFEQWLVKDDLGRSFVHYLRQYAEYNPQPRPGMIALEIPARRIIDFICHRLNVHDGEVLKKDVWFQSYWNETVAAAGVLGRIKAGVIERDVTIGPTIIVRRMIAPQRGHDHSC